MRVAGDTSLYPLRPCDRITVLIALGTASDVQMIFELRFSQFLCLNRIVAAFQMRANRS